MWLPDFTSAVKIVSKDRQIISYIDKAGKLVIWDCATHKRIFCGSKILKTVDFALFWNSVNGKVWQYRSKLAPGYRHNVDLIFLSYRNQQNGFWIPILSLSNLAKIGYVKLTFWLKISCQSFCSHISICSYISSDIRYFQSIRKRHMSIQFWYYRFFVLSTCHKWNSTIQYFKPNRTRNTQIPPGYFLSNTLLNYAFLLKITTQNAFYSNIATLAQYTNLQIFSQKMLKFDQRKLREIITFYMYSTSNSFFFGF